MFLITISCIFINYSLSLEKSCFESLYKRSNDVSPQISIKDNSIAVPLGVYSWRSIDSYRAHSDFYINYKSFNIIAPWYIVSKRVERSSKVDGKAPVRKNIGNCPDRWWITVLDRPANVNNRSQLSHGSERSYGRLGVRMLDTLWSVVASVDNAFVSGAFELFTASYTPLRSRYSSNT